MGAFTRRDSPWWWLYIPTAPKGQQKIKTAIPIGFTPAEKKDAKRAAETLFATKLLQAGKVAEGFHVEPDAILFTAWAATYQAQEIPKHRGAYRERQMLPRLVAWFGDLALTTAPQTWISRADAYRESRLTTPTTVEHYGGKKGKPHAFPTPKPRTVNREVNFLQQMLTCAVEKKLVATSPLWGYKGLKGGPIRRRLTPGDEEERLLPMLAPDDKAIYLIARDGLVRLGDAIDARRPDDFGTTFYFPLTKNGDPVTIPITARLRAALDAVPIDPLKPEWYFPRRRRAVKEEDRTRGYIKAIARACRDAQPPIPYGKKRGGLTFHWSTRTTGATRMIRTGGDGVIADVAKIGGWRDTGVLMEIYQQTVTTDMQRIAELASGAPVVTPAPKPAKSRLRRVK